MRAAHELCPSAHLRYVPNVVDVAAIAPVSAPAGERRAVFVANFAYEPNRNGAALPARGGLPAGVGASCPTRGSRSSAADLEAAGRAATSACETLGFVADLADAYAHASCALVPLLQGGGTPLKLIEALAYGLPVIATPRAVAGLEVRDGEHCLVAEGARGFAAALAHGAARGQHARAGSTRARARG